MTSPARLRTSRSHTGPVPPPAESRAGFVLYVSLPESGTDGAALPSAADLTETAEALRELAQEALPGSETYATLSLASGSSSPHTIDATRGLPAVRLLRPVTGPGTTDVLSGSGDAG